MDIRKLTTSELNMMNIQYGAYVLMWALAWYDKADDDDDFNDDEYGEDDDDDEDDEDDDDEDVCRVSEE